MPALSNGNTCWGNRKAFNMQTDFMCDSFPLGNIFEDTTERRDFISTNTYYGFHRIPEPPVEESMAVDEIEPQNNICDNATACRKRPNSADENMEIVKRIRQQEPPLLQQQPQPGPSHSTYELRRHNINTNSCLL